LSDPTYYLFDGYNLMHAGDIHDRRELVDRLAGWVALQGARGAVVFDGVGEEGVAGPLEVRFDPHADRVIERLAAEHRERETVCIVSSDAAIRETAGPAVRKRSAKEFLREVDDRPPRPPVTPPPARSRVEDALDPETRARLERWRRRH
jgi:predicted RNA-binding protein with PIN domain